MNRNIIIGAHVLLLLLATLNLDLAMKIQECYVQPSECHLWLILARLLVCWDLA